MCGILIPYKGAGDIAVGFVSGDEDLVAVIHSELFQVEGDMVFVGHSQGDLFDGGKFFQHVFSHRV